MGRIARAVAPGWPHHITQRGNRRIQVFFSEDDYRLYLDLMSASCGKLGIEVWAYCLMPNHVHLIVNPRSEDGLRRAIGDAHRRYSRHVNFREGWRGHLFQGRFASFVMDERYLLAAARYVELNPVRAGLADRAWRWKWSSARAHRRGRDDALVTVRPLLDLAGDWEEFLSVSPSEDGLRRAIGDAHRRYSRHVNFREDWRGHLFQGRFASFVMDERYLLAAARYVELNPVRAGLADKAWRWKWSSARAHRRGRDDALVTVKPLLNLAGDWEEFLSVPASEEERNALRRHERTGRPLGEAGFVRKIERTLHRIFRPRKPGPKPRTQHARRKN